MHAAAEALRQGEEYNWSSLSQLNPPAYPNRLSKEQYIVEAVKELASQEAQSEPSVTSVPDEGTLTRSERDLISRLREKVLAGKEVDWDEIEHRGGRPYAHKLKRRTILILIAKQIEELVQESSE